MRRYKSWLVIATMVALVIPIQAGAQSPPAPQEVVQAILGQIEVIANQNGVNANDLLHAEIKIQPSDGSDPIPVTVEDAILRIAGKSIIDPEFHGILGTPQANAGDILHFFTDLQVDTFNPPLTFAQFSAQPAPTMAKYSVLESGLVPSTPLVPVPNPLALTGQPLPPEVPAGLASPLLFVHWGGRLKSIQASGYDFGVSVQLGTTTLNSGGSHSAGTTATGSNVDTEDTTANDPWPVWLPVLTGDAARPDEQIDFLGFGQVLINTQIPCIPTLAFVSGVGLRVTKRTCISLGAMLGDGASLFDGAPVDLRATTAAVGVWNPVPEPLATVLSALEQAIADAQGMIPPLPSVPSVPSVPTTAECAANRWRLVLPVATALVTERCPARIPRAGHLSSLAELSSRGDG